MQIKVHVSHWNPVSSIDGDFVASNRNAKTDSRLRKRLRKKKTRSQSVLSRKQSKSVRSKWKRIQRKWRNHESTARKDAQTKISDIPANSKIGVVDWSIGGRYPPFKCKTCKFINRRKKMYCEMCGARKTIPVRRKGRPTIRQSRQCSAYEAAMKMRAHSALSSGMLGSSSFRASVQPRKRPFVGYTENGAVTLTTSGDPCVDFFFQVLPDSDVKDVRGYLEAAWDHDPLSALRLIFHLRDIREGKGDREQFYECLDWMAEYHPQTLLVNMEWFPKYGYWKDLLMFVLRQLEGVEARIARHKELEEIQQKRDANNARITQHKIQRYLKKGDDFDLGVIARKRLERCRVVDEETGRTVREQNVEKNITAGRLAKEEAHSRRERERIERAELILTKKGERDSFFGRFYERVVVLFAKQLAEDLEKMKSGYSDLTLCAKWAPRLGGSFDRRAHLGRAIAVEMFGEAIREDWSQMVIENKEMEESDRKAELVTRIACEKYRKEVCVPLRRYLECPEVKMSARKWNEVNYERTPSVCIANNARHFMVHDRTRFQKYLTDVAMGVKKIACAAVMPHQLIYRCAQVDDKIADLQFQGIIRKLRESGSFSNSLAICDVSGSMSGLPMDAAIGLSMILAELSDGIWHRRMVTFSEKPQFFVVPRGTLHRKVVLCKKMPWGMSTNYFAVFTMILRLAKHLKLRPAAMIKRLYVFSDMEFDTSGGREFETTHEQIKRMYRESGFRMPQIVYWNLRSNTSRAIPASASESGVALVSGMNASLLKIFMDGTDADWTLESGGGAKDVLDVVLKSERYANVNVVVD